MEEKLSDFPRKEKLAAVFEKLCRKEELDEALTERLSDVIRSEQLGDYYKKDELEGILEEKLSDVPRKDKLAAVFERLLLSGSK